MNYRAFHKLSYGLYIIATEFEGVKAGYIGNTAFQVTSTPSKVAISSHKDNFTTQKIIDSNRFSLSVLKKEVETSLIGKFGFMSGEDIDKFQGVESITSVTGAPIVLDSCVAWFDCKVLETVDIGTHMLIIGEVVESDLLSNEEALTYDYYHKKYKMFAPKNAPTYIEQNKLGEEPEPEPVEKVKEPESKPTSAGARFTCSICGFQYDPEEGDPSMGIPPGTAWEDVPDDYKCPICNAGKEYFKES